MTLLTKSVEQPQMTLRTAPSRLPRYPVSPFPITFKKNQPRVQPKKKARDDETPAERKQRLAEDEGANFFYGDNELVGKFHYHSLTYAQAQVRHQISHTSFCSLVSGDYD